MEGGNEQKSKSTSEALMESLRKNPPQARSINELVKLLHVISAEQRSCNVLRSCVDKVLMNMSNIRTLRDYIERLRSVSRTNGFRFELPGSSGPETRCCLVSDMFSVKILLGTSSSHDHSPTVLDVKIQHHRDDFRSCLHLVDTIRAGNFLELSKHLKGLTEMYLTSGNKQMRTRVFVALQSLETDLVKMSHVYRETHKDATNLDIVTKGTVGLLTPRVAGNRSHLTYYVSPYDLIDVTSRTKISIGDTVPKHIGLHAEVGIEQSSAACNLPISPLISNKHPINSTGLPRFAEVGHHNSTMVQACFVLYLSPAVPVLSKVAEKIRQVTNLPLESETKTPVPYLEMLHGDKNTYKIAMGERSTRGETLSTMHVYHLNMSELKGTKVSKVYFTHPGHVTEILDHLRLQAYLNTLISSCIRKNTKNDKGKEEQWYFEVNCGDEMGKVNITLEHPQPSCKGTAFLEVQLQKDGTCGCKIYTGRGDPPLCSDQYVAKVLQKCSSIPITMMKLIDQSIEHPRKESDIHRVRPPALFGATSHPVVPRAPNILTPVQRPPVPQRRLSTSSAPSTSFAGTPTVSMAFSGIAERTTEMGKKVVKNPMLAKLLIPTSISTNQSDSSVQPKNHPMLMTLLKDDDRNNDMSQNMPRSTPPGSKTSQMMFPHSQSQMGGMQQSQFNSANMMGLISPNTTFPGMDPSIPVPAAHQMPPPSYPTHHLQNQYSNPGSMPSLSPVQHSPVGGQQFQVAQSPRSSIDDMTGPVTPTYQMMSPNMMSSSMPPTPNMPVRGRRGSRQQSRSTEGQHPLSSMDFSNLELPAPTTFESQMSVESDTSISELLGIQNKQGMTPLRRTDSMSPGIGGHLLLQHTSSLKSLSEAQGNTLVRTVSIGNAKSPRSISSSPRNLKTPTLATPEPNMVGLGSPTNSLFEGGLNQMQRGSRVRSYDGHLDMGGRNEFFRLPPNSTSPAGLSSMSVPSSAVDSDADPFTFDDNKNPSKISMPESTVGVSRGGKPLVFTSNQSSMSNTGASDTLRELAKSKPVLLRALTSHAPSPDPKSETANLQRLLSPSVTGFIPNFTSATNTQANMSTAATFDMPNKFVTTTSVGNLGEKSLVRQNAVDKQPGVSAQGKAGETKGEKTVKRRNSNKGEDGKPPAKKRGRPPGQKDHGGKKKKSEVAVSSAVSQDEAPPASSKITLNIKLSPAGTPISSVTKTKLYSGPSQPEKKSFTETSSSSNSPATSTGNPTSAINPSGGFGVLDKYLKNQQELTKRKRDMKDKKVVNKSGTTAKQALPSGQSSVGNVAVSEKPQIASAAAKQPATAPQPQKRSRKNSIKDVIEKLRTAKQTAEKDANSNLLTKGKPIVGSPSHQKIQTSTAIKGILKSNAEEKPAKGVASKPVSHAKTVPPKGMDLSAVGKSVSLSSAAGQGVRDFSPALQQLIRKDSGAKATRVQSQDGSNENMSMVLKQIMESAAVSAGKSTTVMHTQVNKPIVKAARPPQVKARSITPTPATTGSAIQRKSPSQMLKAGDLSPAFRQLAGKTGAAVSSGSSTPPVKKSPSRPPGTFGGHPSRPSSASSIEAGLRTLSSSPTAALRKPGDQFVAPSISPTPKRTTSPQIARTTPPLTRVEDKGGKGPHKPSPTGSRTTTQMSPQSPDGRLVIDDGNMPAPSAAPAGLAQSMLSRDEQRPLFLHTGNRLSDRQSPERAVTESPLSPPSAGQKNLLRRTPTPRSSNVSPAIPSIPSVGGTESPCPIDDDLMDQAVGGGL